MFSSTVGIPGPTLAKQAAEKGFVSCHPDPACGRRICLCLLSKKKQQILRCAPSKVIQPLCHSEERNDEESALREEHKKQIPRFARNDRPGVTFMYFGGPKAHVTLRMTGNGTFILTYPLFPKL